MRRMILCQPQTMGKMGLPHAKSERFLTLPFRVAGRTKWYDSVNEMQKDLEVYLKHYNGERAHQGRNMKGRTPYQAFIDGIVKQETKENEMKEAA